MSINKNYFRLVFNNIYLNIAFLVLNLLIIIQLIWLTLFPAFAVATVIEGYNSTLRPLIDQKSTWTIYCDFRFYHIPLIFYLYVLLLFLMAFLSRYAPRKIGIVYILVAIKLFMLQSSTALIVQYSLMIAFSALMYLGSSSGHAFNYEPNFVLLLYSSVICLVLAGSLLLCSSKKKYVLSNTQPTKTHSTLNLIALILLVSFAVPQITMIFNLVGRVSSSIITVIFHSIPIPYVLFILIYNIVLLILSAGIILFFQSISEPTMEGKTSIFSYFTDYENRKYWKFSLITTYTLSVNIIISMNLATFWFGEVSELAPFYFLTIPLLHGIQRGCFIIVAGQVVLAWDYIKKRASLLHNVQPTAVSNRDNHLESPSIFGQRRTLRLLTLVPPLFYVICFIISIISTFSMYPSGNKRYNNLGNSAIYTFLILSFISLLLFIQFSHTTKKKGVYKTSDTKNHFLKRPNLNLELFSPTEGSKAIYNTVKKSFKVVVILLLILAQPELIVIPGLFPFIIPRSLNYNDSFGLNTYIERDFTISNGTFYSNGTFLLTFAINWSYYNPLVNFSFGSPPEYFNNSFLYVGCIISSLFFDFNQDLYADLTVFIYNESYLVAPPNAVLHDTYDGQVFITYLFPGTYILKGQIINVIFSPTNDTFGVAIGNEPSIYSNFYYTSVHL